MLEDMELAENGVEIVGPREDIVRNLTQNALG